MTETVFYPDYRDALALASYHTSCFSPWPTQQDLTTKRTAPALAPNGVCTGDAAPTYLVIPLLHIFPALASFSHDSSIASKLTTAYPTEWHYRETARLFFDLTKKIKKKN